MKTLNPSVRVIGVEPKRCASFSVALEAGKPVMFDDVQATLADGVRPLGTRPASFSSM